MPRAALSVAEVFRRYGDAFRTEVGAALSTAQSRVMTAIVQCRTAALGGHVEQCDRCGHRRVWYNSCRNRHCPACQSLARAEWLERRRADLLPTEYFHVVFTVPPAVAEIAAQNKAVVYGLLFRAVADTLRTIAADPAPPRRRDRLLRRPPHLGPDARPPSAPALRHPGWGARWRRQRLGRLPPRVSSCRSGSSHATSAGFSSRRWQTPSSPDSSASPAGCSPSPMPGASPSTFAQPARPNGSSTRSGHSPAPKQVLDYLGRYTHRIAISNQRLRSLDDGAVRFRYTDYRSNGASRHKTMTLAAPEFIRRMLLHVLPPGFHRIRHYGFLANRARQRKLAECRRALCTSPPPAPQQDAPVTDYRERYEALTGRSLRQCPRCHAGNMQPTDQHAGTARPAILDSS